MHKNKVTTCSLLGNLSYSTGKDSGLYSSLLPWFLSCPFPLQHQFVRLLILILSLILGQWVWAITRTFSNISCGAHSPFFSFRSQTLNNHYTQVPGSLQFASKPLLKHRQTHTPHLCWHAQRVSSSRATAPGKLPPGGAPAGLERSLVLLGGHSCPPSSKVSRSVIHLADPALSSHHPLPVSTSPPNKALLPNYPRLQLCGCFQWQHSPPHRPLLV